MTSSSQLSSIHCPECDASPAVLLDGLCPSCGFPLESLVQFVENLALSTASGGLERCRSGAVTGVISFNESFGDGRIIVVQNDARYAVSYVSTADNLPIDIRGTLRLSGALHAKFYPLNPSTSPQVSNDADLQAEIQALVEQPTYPRSVAILQTYATLNLIGGVIASFVLFANDQGLICTALLVESICLSAMLHAFHQSVSAGYHTRAIVARLAVKVAENSRHSNLDH